MVISMLRTSDMLSSQVGNPKKNPHFSVTLRRAFLHKAPPVQKTIFILRHGESKWNKAQKSGNMISLLDRDHALTEKGFLLLHYQIALFMLL
jgi:hypothetical protein